MNTSITVMAHPKRAAAATSLATTVGASITWDQRDDEWDTGSRAIASATGDWHCVLQDDAVPIPNLPALIDQAIATTPVETLISLYAGTGQPIQARVTRAVAAGTPWLSHKTLLWGVGILIPTHHIPALLDWAQHRKEPYDRRLGNYFHNLGLPVLYTNPSLVDHLDERSLLHSRSIERRAHKVGVPQWGATVYPI